MAIQPIKFLVSPSATATNGSKTITVTGNVDCSHVYSGTAIALGTRQVVEAVSGTKPDGSGNSVITLRDSWAEPTTTAKLVAFNTIEGLAEAVRRAREVVQASEAALSGNISYMGDHSAAAGNFPAAPGEGLGSQIYRISIAGTISGRDYKVGELIYYDQYFNQWRSFFDGFGSAAQRHVGNGTADLPDNARLNERLGTAGNLGNAAQRNVMTSPTDTTTPNALMPRGAFGLGQSATRRATQLDDEFVNSFSSTSATWNNSPYPGLDANNQGGAITLKHEDSTYWWNLWFGLGRDEIRFRRIAAGIAGAWRTLYQNSNIVGVVSHSAGMPTGGILYYGENPTGKYLLLADGTGFWWKRVNFSGLVINPAANGNLNTSINCDISQPFSLLDPVISLSAAVCKTSGGQIVYVAKQDSGLPIIVNTGHMPSTSWPYLDTVGTAVITNGYYELSAVGRWY